MGAWRLYDPWWYWIGRPLLGALYLSGVFRQSISSIERTGPQPVSNQPLARLSSAQARTALSQLARVQRDNLERMRFGRTYGVIFREAGWPAIDAVERTPCLRYPFVVVDRDRVDAKLEEAADNAARKAVTEATHKTAD